MSEDAEPDQLAGAEHPRRVYAIHGHGAAEAEIDASLRQGRAHHAWLISGARGLGKATLAYRFARKLLGARIIGPRPFDADPEDPICRRIAALSHPDLFVLRRGLNDQGRPRRDISVEDARALNRFFTLQPAEGGYRVAIVDSVDELSRSAANAILKTLEEPPARSVLVLIAHAPGAALATIRSRCRKFPLRAVDDAGVERVLGAAGFAASSALLALAAGRPGRAIALAQGEGAVLAERLAAALAGDPVVLAGDAFARGGDAGERLKLFLELAGEALRRAAGQCVDQQRFAAAQAWAEAHAELLSLRETWEALSLDPGHAYLRSVGILERARRLA